jgi:hypothetical protein
MSGASPPDRAPPLLAYERVTHLPTRRGNVRVEVDRMGGVRFQRNDSEPEGALRWDRPFPVEPRSIVPDAEARLGRLLQRGGFFTMPLIQASETSTDGVREVLAWFGAKGPREVVVDRVRVPVFAALRGKLFRLLDLEGIA